MVLVLQACISRSRALVPSLPEAVFCLRYAQSRDFYICLRINRNIHKENFEYQVRRNPKAVALIFESKEYTYGDIDEQANRVANWAIEQGIKPKDTVALLMPVWCFFCRFIHCTLPHIFVGNQNRVAFPVIRLGLVKAGARVALVCIPNLFHPLWMVTNCIAKLNTNVTGLPLAHVLNTSTASILIIGSELIKSYQSLEDMPHHLDVPRPQLSKVWVHDENGSDDCETTPGFYSLNRALEKASSKDNNFAAIRSSIVPADVAYYIYTSGTTGLPKVHLSLLCDALC